MKTDIDGLQSGIVTLSEVLAERGVDFERHCESLAHEVRVMQEMGLQHPYSVAVETAEGKEIERDEPDDDDPAPPPREPEPPPINPPPAQAPQPTKTRERKVKRFAIETPIGRGRVEMRYVDPEFVRPIYEKDDEHLDAETVLGI